MENQKNSIPDTCIQLGLGLHQQFKIKGLKDNPYHFTEDALVDINNTKCNHLIGCLVSGELIILPQPEFTGLSTITVKMISKLKAEHICVSDEIGEYRKRLYSFRPQGCARIWRVTIENDGREETCTEYKAIHDAVAAYNRILTWKILYEGRKNAYLKELNHAKENMENICTMLGIGLQQKFKIKGAKHNPYYFTKHKLIGSDGKNHKKLVEQFTLEIREITPLPEYVCTETVDWDALANTEIVHVLASSKNKTFRKRLYAVMSANGLKHRYRVVGKGKIRGQTEKKQRVFEAFSVAISAYNSLNKENFSTWSVEQDDTDKDAEDYHPDPDASCSIKTSK